MVTIKVKKMILEVLIGIMTLALFFMLRDKQKDEPTNEEDSRFKPIG